VTAVITGSTGFVGKNLSLYLSDRGVEIQPLTREVLERGEIRLPKDCTTIHLAGIAHDLHDRISADEYFNVNYGLTKRMYDAFVASDAKTFIFLSSIKAVAESSDDALSEETEPHPDSPYGLSKRAAEEYIESCSLPEGKRLYILRPCIIHGPSNKGNLNLLYEYIAKGYPYPLAALDNRRSFLSIENLCFVINELIAGEVGSGTYNLADNESLTTTEVVRTVCEVVSRPPRIWRVPSLMVKFTARLGDLLHLAFTSKRLDKLSEGCLVSNTKIKEALGKDLPVDARTGLRKTFEWLRKGAA